MCSGSPWSRLPSAPRAQDAPTQPPQPKHGPGGSDYTHKGVRVSSGGTGADAWYAFEPIHPRPKKAPLAIVMHGYFEFSGYDADGRVHPPHGEQGKHRHLPALADRHRDSVSGPVQHRALHRVGGQRDQRSARVPALGSEAGPAATSKDELLRLLVRRDRHGEHANRYQALGLPKPQAIFLDDPHDGGLAQAGSTSRRSTTRLRGSRRATKFECHSGADGVLAEPGSENSRAATRCFPKLTSIPAKNKDLVLTHTDDHGQPTLSSAHGVCAGGPVTGAPNAYDWNFCWKVWDALRSCATDGRTAATRSATTASIDRSVSWSDGVPVIPLKIQDAAPIGP